MVFLVTASAEPSNFQWFCVIVMVSLAMLIAAGFTWTALDRAVDESSLREATGALALKTELGSLLLAVLRLCAGHWLLPRSVGSNLLHDM